MEMVERRWRRGHLPQDHFGSVHRSPVEKRLGQKVHLHASQQDLRRWRWAGPAVCSRCLLLVQDLEGCSYVGSKTNAWSEMSPGGASGLVSYPSAINGWENQPRGEVLAISLSEPIAAKLIPIKKKLSDPDLIPALDVWLGARHRSELARAELRAGGKGRREETPPELAEGLQRLK